MYEVWRSHGDGTRIGPRFRVLGDAVRHVYNEGPPGSYAIRYPDGSWHRWHTGEPILRVNGPTTGRRARGTQRSLN